MVYKRAAFYHHRGFHVY